MTPPRVAAALCLLALRCAGEPPLHHPHVTLPVGWLNVRHQGELANWMCCQTNPLRDCTTLERGVDETALGPLHRLRKRHALIIVGEQKAGTTFLFELLAKVPGFDASKRKETNYFRLPTITGCNLRDYLSNFRTGLNETGDVLVEASPEYLMLPNAAAALAQALPRARIVVLARDPVERAHAAWDQQRRERRDSRSFERAMQDELRAAVSCDAKAATLAAASGRAGSRGPDGGKWVFDKRRWLAAAKQYEDDCAAYYYFRSTCPRDRPGCKLYLHKARVASHADHWLTFFPQHRVAVVNASKLYAEPAKVLASVATFGGATREAVEEALRAPVEGKTCWHACHVPKKPLQMNDRLRESIEAVVAPERARLATMLEELTPDANDMVANSFFKDK